MFRSEHKCYKIGKKLYGGNPYVCYYSRIEEKKKKNVCVHVVEIILENLSCIKNSTQSIKESDADAKTSSPNMIIKESTALFIPRSIWLEALTDKLFSISRCEVHFILQPSKK